MNNAQKQYDVIIIGAGLAGCVLGFLLKKQKKKVLIIEQQNSKRKLKLCGGLLTQKSYDILKEIYNDEIKKLDIIAYKKAYIINKTEKIKFDNINLYTIYRKELDDFVLNEYLKIDGEIVDNTTYTNLDLEKQKIIINNSTYKFEYLVGADGVFSQVRRNIFGCNQKKNFALESNIKTQHQNLEIYFFDKLKSYGWILPNNKYSMIGIGDVSSKTKLEEDFDNYLNQINVVVPNKKGAFLPTGNDFCLEYNHYVRFIGDAAGLISPITGEGIYYAVFSAKKLSEDFINYKFNMRKTIKHLRKEDFFKKIIYNHKIRSFVFNRHNRKIFRRIIDKFAKKIL